jgi:hypothetical protein
MTADKRTRRAERQRVRYHADPDRHKRTQREGLAELRVRGLIHYAGDPPRCACCGEFDTTFLTFDHVDGGGAQHRKTDPGAKELTRWLHKRGFPDGFRVLCFSCNGARHIRSGDGRCPHEIQRAVLALFTDPGVRLVSLADL